MIFGKVLRVLTTRASFSRFSFPSNPTRNQGDLPPLTSPPLRAPALTATTRPSRLRLQSAWETLREAVLAILTEKTLGASLQTLFRLVEDLCVSSAIQMLYEQVHTRVCVCGLVWVWPAPLPFLSDPSPLLLPLSSALHALGRASLPAAPRHRPELRHRCPRHLDASRCRVAGARRPHAPNPRDFSHVGSLCVFPSPFSG